MQVKLPPLTYTFLSNYENCPHKAYRLYVVKDVKSPPNDAMNFGIFAHKDLQHRLDLGPVKYPLKEPAWEKFCAAIEHQRAKTGYTLKCEDGIGMSTHFLEVPFFDETVWMRGKADVTLVSPTKDHAVFFDWKTGSSRYEDSFELEIQALLLRARYPTLKNLTGCYVWLKDGKFGRAYNLGDRNKTMLRISKSLKLMDAGAWEKEPNPLCGWCPVLDCQYNRTEEA